MKKRILFTYATYGNGHKSASNNIMNYFLSKSDEFEIKELDISNFRSFTGKIVEKSFEANFKHANSFGFGALYRLFNNKYSLMPMNSVTKKIYKYETLKKLAFRSYIIVLELLFKKYIGLDSNPTQYKKTDSIIAHR